MIKDFDYSNRQLLPRWLPFKDFRMIHPQVQITRPLNLLEQKDYKNSLENWEKNKNIAYALELISLSHVFELADTFSYKSAVDFILNDHLDVLNQNPFLSDFLGKTKVNDDTRDKIHFVRKQLHQNCTNPTLWIDLAYYYEISGQKKQAAKAIRTALYLQPQNIFLIRAIAKYFILENEIDYALSLLNDDNIKSNPLIISAEISIAEAYNKKSRLLRIGSSLIKNENISNNIENELFATIGTMEFNNGNSKKGKKLITQSLMYPNENVIAQTRYISAKFQKQFDISQYNVPNRYETDAWLSYNANNFEKVLEMSEKWFYFQPFTSTSAIMNSYISSLIFQDEKHSVEMAQKALKVSPASFSLQNNLVVALFRQGQTERANEEFEKLKKLKIYIKDDETVLLATSGLVDYRNGKHEIGRSKYKEAVMHFEKNNDHEKLSRCFYYWGCEAKNAKEADYISLIQSAKALAEKYNINEIQTAIKRNFNL